MKQFWNKKIGQGLLAICGIYSCVTANAQGAGADDKKDEKPITKAELDKIMAGYAGSKKNFDGDELKISTNVTGFKTLDDPALVKCAPISSKLIVSDESGDNLYVYFKDIPKNSSDSNQKDASKSSSGLDQSVIDGLAACKPDNIVNLYTLYKIEKMGLSHYGFKRTGFEFGALVVPFKFHLGVNEFSSSPTVAPYLGYSIGFLQSRGIKFTPIFSAGMAFVPITPKEGGTSRTTPAFSTAIGVILTSDKNENFNAGLLFGRDFLGKSERNFDTKIGKPWISFYVGYNVDHR